MKRAYDNELLDKIAAKSTVDIPLALIDEEIDRIIGDCGIHDDKTASPTGKHDATELLDECKKWGGVSIAAHVTSNSGLLMQLHGQARVNAWKHKELLACSIPGPVSG